MARRKKPSKQAAPKQAAPKQAASKQAAPKQAAPKQAAPKQSAPKKNWALDKDFDTCAARTFDPLEYVTEKELNDIDAQLASALAGVDVVLFWTGIDWAYAQKWSAIWGIKTLTVAMGPLMDSSNPNSPKAQRGKSYSRYVKGASGRFAQYASQHCRVLVLTNPPPCVYSSRENNTYQRLEEPILKGHCGNAPVRRIDYLHPTVDGAAHVTYQVWPFDKTQDWTGYFSGSSIRKWKGLNWSYKSLVTTSQLKLKPYVEQDATAFDIKGHESRDLDPQPTAGASVGSDNERIETRIHNQVERGVDFHELGLLDKSDRPQTPVYVIERCLPPASLLAVPVVSIDDLPVGIDVDIDINEHDSNEDFLYLTVKAGAELKWWKLRWE
ncbi:uncharacterized protein HMPREF1541_09016 [Cyphellophora europaea CBS 101466]|uniref:Uncharacterized protein n=1 Tax=Cyphellophora europaea (strain CBS 101466) TaxID=1220924 RepID=W2RM07_CYPE1|nr:uncharacterized protein HMPREF1541_09016 [Cyphellophora europaea CBS 101466]ETN36738.1 hypothetical protein HMPREF1541_09016 [Cyphellophora europaea CBS 101466]